ncbi:signal peptidase I [Candidatus Babeliales bacterium]|nr:signal peptidase I [Candidatus Babeliales bacterium]MBP9844400.1 signal peptidase I [Candidatus Babeliales bacterium]
MVNNRSYFKSISWSLLITILIFVIFKMFVQHYRLSGDCMEPSFKDGQSYFVNRISPYVRQYQIGDVVVFKYENKNWIARVVALENDTIEINEEKILVNNIQLKDKVAKNWVDWKYGVYAVDKTIKIPSGHIFVLSDNLSAHHDDSRVFGPISNLVIVGVVW